MKYLLVFSLLILTCVTKTVNVEKEEIEVTNHTYPCDSVPQTFYFEPNKYEAVTILVIRDYGNSENRAYKGVMAQTFLGAVSLEKGYCNFGSTGQLITCNEDLYPGQANTDVTIRLIGILKKE